MPLARTISNNTIVFVATNDTLLLPQVTERWNLIITNSTQDTCYLSLGTFVSDTLYTYKMTRGSTIECGAWRGEVHAMMASTPGYVNIAEES